MGPLVYIRTISLLPPIQARIINYQGIESVKPPRTI